MCLHDSQRTGEKECGMTINEITVVCPTCKASVGWKCRTFSGHTRQWSHKARVDAYKLLIGELVARQKALEGQ